MTSWARDPVELHPVYEDGESLRGAAEPEPAERPRRTPRTRPRRRAPFVLLAMAGAAAGLLATRSPLDTTRRVGRRSGSGAPVPRSRRAGAQLASRRATRALPTAPRASAHRNARPRRSRALPPPVPAAGVVGDGAASPPVGSRVEFGFER